MKSKSRKQSMKNKSHKKTLKSKSNKNVIDYIVHCLMRVRHTIKVFHWTTKNYGTHKITDKFTDKLDDAIDKYVEIYLGKASNDSTMDKKKKMLEKRLKSITSHDVKNKEDLIKVLNHMIEKLNHHEHLNERHELLAVRDEIIGELQTMKYLLNLRG